MIYSDKNFEDSFDVFAEDIGITEQEIVLEGGENEK